MGRASTFARESVTSCVVLGLVLVLSSVSNAQEVWWSDAGADHLWDNPDNWSTGVVPTAGDEVTIDVPAAAAPNGPVIQDGIAAVASGVITAMPGVATLTMTGGTLELSSYIWWGDGPDSFPVWNMSGGTVTVSGTHELGWAGGGGTMIMTGGTVTSGSLVAPTSSGAYAQLFLYDGTYSTSSLSVNANGLVDIHDGTLVVDGDIQATVLSLIDDGQIIGFDGLATVLYDYDTTNTGKTTVWSTFGAVTLTWDGGGNGNWGDRAKADSCVFQKRRRCDRNLCGSISLLIRLFMVTSSGECQSLQ